MTTRAQEYPSRRWMEPAAAVLVCALLCAAALASAQENADGRTLRTGDTLRMTVPGRPELDQDLVIATNGTVEVDQIGEIRLEGFTLQQASVLMKQRLRLIYPTLDSLLLQMAGSGAVRIYVMGQAVRSGVINFEDPPTLWDVLRAAGGPTKDANLRQARLIREEAEGSRVVPLDLSGLLEGDDVPEIVLRDGDTVVIPRLADGISGVAGAEGVKVFGSVKQPSVVAVDEPTPLMDVLMLAGSPTSEADLKKVWWVHTEDQRAESRLVDLDSYLRLGNPAGNPLLYPGDTIKVSADKPGFVRRDLPLFLGTLAAVATIYLAFNQSSN